MGMENTYNSVLGKQFILALVAKYGNDIKRLDDQLSKGCFEVKITCCERIISTLDSIIELINQSQLIQDERFYGILRNACDMKFKSRECLDVLRKFH